MGRIWVLGASDPEMRAIETLLYAAVEDFVHAVDARGERVHPGNAYSAAPPRVGDNTVYAVECAWAGAPKPSKVIDHHRPGDPGWGVPPARYQSGASVGRVMAELSRVGRLPADWPGRREVPYIAAADHCLAAAYRGECPGIHPDALLRWRAASRAALQERRVDAVMADVEAAMAALRAAPRLALSPAGGADVADMRGRDVPELPEAAARLGVAFIATPRPGPDDRQKVVLQAAGPEHLAAWPSWAKAQGLVDLYGGDAARGFAGGYLA